MTINTISSRDRATIESYAASMQAGPAGLDKLVGLFDDEAIYIEPFAGEPTTHSGRAEIRAFFDIALRQHLQGIRLIVDRLDLDGSRLRSTWTCQFPGMSGQMRGFDLIEIRDGRILRLETTVTEFPPMPS